MSSPQLLRGHASPSVIILFIILNNNSRPMPRDRWWSGMRGTALPEFQSYVVAFSWWNSWPSLLCFQSLLVLVLSSFLIPAFQRVYLCLNELINIVLPRLQLVNLSLPYWFLAKDMMKEIVNSLRMSNIFCRSLHSEFIENRNFVHSSCGEVENWDLLSRRLIWDQFLNFCVWHSRKNPGPEAKTPESWPWFCNYLAM